MTSLELYRHQAHPEHYTQQLEQKTQRLQQLFADFTPPPLQIHASAPLGFRLRTEFRIWHNDGECCYTMSAPGDKHKRYVVQDFPIASELIQTLMPRLLQHIAAHAILKQRLFQVEFLTTLSCDAIITLTYHKPLDDAWKMAAQTLQTVLGFPVLGRSRKQKCVLTRDYVTEVLTVDGHRYTYRQIEGSFTQPNGGMNQQMLSWAQTQSRSHQGDLLELYCGNGNFSIALSGCYRRILATEISKTSVLAAQENIRANNISNLIIARLSSEEFVQAQQGERPFRRLQNIDLCEYDFQTVLVDPPRAGLDQASLAHIQRYPNIIYISCNPISLRDNLKTLCQTHKFDSFALFDQFPYTDHIETGVVLRQKAVI